MEHRNSNARHSGGGRATSLRGGLWGELEKLERQMRLIRVLKDAQESAVEPCRVPYHWACWARG